MAGTNDFLPFATGAGANVLSPSAYAAMTTLLAQGFTAGLAESQQLNTVWRQSGFVASVVAKMIADISGQNVADDGVQNNFEKQLLLTLGLANYGVDSGAANAYAVTFTDSIGAAVLVDGLSVSFRALNTNTGASTLNWNGLGAKDIWTADLQPLSRGEILALGEVHLTWNSSVNSGNGAWILKNSSTAVPAGSIIYVPGNAAPTGFVKANGAALSRTAYPVLYSYAVASGNMAASDGAWTEGQFSPGDGSTTFRIPDLRGRFLRGWDDARGIDSGRAIGSSQAGSTQSHYHQMQSGGSGSGTIWATGDTSGSTNPTVGNVADGTETRPANIAELACIKY